MKTIKIKNGNANVGNWLFACLVVLGLTSCNDEALVRKNHRIAKFGWHSDSVVITPITTPQGSPIAPYKLIYNVKYNTIYPYHNLHIKYLIEEENGNVVLQGLHDMNLFDPITGEPVGSGFGSLYQKAFLAIDSLPLKPNANYSVKIYQMMRLDTLKGIEIFGVEVAP